MGRHNFKWTPEAVARLRELSGAIRDRDIAERFGCSLGAVQTKRHELKFPGRSRSLSDDVRKYMEQYGVSEYRVRRVGVARLNRMEESARGFYLRSPLISHKKSAPKHRPYIHETPGRIERMMQLAERCA